MGKGEKAEKSFWCAQSQQNTPSITEFKNELTQVAQVKKKVVSLVVLAQEFPLGPGEAHSSGITPREVSRKCLTLQHHPACISTAEDTALTQRCWGALFKVLNDVTFRQDLVCTPAMQKQHARMLYAAEKLPVISSIYFMPCFPLLKMISMANTQFLFPK